MDRSVYSDFAPFDLQQQEYPKRIREDILNFLYLVQKQLHQIESLTVTDLYALHPSQWYRFPTKIQMLTFGTYRKFFPLVELLSVILAPLYLEFGILPDLYPLFPDRMKEYEKTILPSLKKAGILVFSREI